MKQFYNHKTYLIPLLTNYQFRVIKRTMLSRGSMACKQSIPLKDAEQLARSALGFIKTFNNKEMVYELGLTFKNNVATPKVTEQFVSYVKDNANLGGTAIIKTNFLASFTHQDKSLTYNYIDIKKNLHPKLKTHESLNGKVFHVRSLVEIPIAENFAVRFPQIESVTLLGDNVPILNRTKNVFRDLSIEFFNGKKKDMDIKTGILDRNIHYGHIREIAVNSSGELISYPRHFDNLPDQYSLVFDYLKKNDARKNLTITDREYYDIEVNHLHTLITNKPLVMKNHQVIENSMMNINSLPSYNSNLNFYNVYHIKNGNVTPNEIKFLETAIKDIDPSILEKPIHMQKYLVHCLHLYNELIDPKMSENIKSLRHTYPFIKEFLKNNNDIYL